MADNMMSKFIKRTQGKPAAVPVERKMELAKYIREENMGNRMKVRQREKILYGVNDPLPLFSKEKRSTYYTDMETQDNSQETIVGSTFRLRMTAAIILFVGFLLCDAGGYHVFGYSMNDIYEMIEKDYFQAGDALEEGSIQLTELLDFDR